MATIAQALKDAIQHERETGVSLNAIAHATGIDYGTLHRFVNGERNIQLHVAQRIADHYGLELRPRRGE